MSKIKYPNQSWIKSKTGLNRSVVVSLTLVALFSGGIAGPAMLAFCTISFFSRLSRVAVVGIIIGAILSSPYLLMMGLIQTSAVDELFYERAIARWYFAAGLLLNPAAFSLGFALEADHATKSQSL